MAKINIFRKEWLDLVFEGRNKSYGAYRLRSNNPKVTALALLLGIGLFGVGIASPLIIGSIYGTLGITNTETNDKVIKFDHIVPPATIDVSKEEIKPAKSTPKAPVSKKDQVKYKPLVVETAVLVKYDDDVPSLDDLKEADPSSQTVKGNPEGNILIGDVDLKETKGNAEDGVGNQIFTHVQVPAGPPGGMISFNRIFVNRFRAPELHSSVKKIHIIVQFIVERDGSITEINVLRDPGYGAGKEAVRVLKTMPKWKPAVQNGETVRSRLTLPITIQVQ